MPRTKANTIKKSKNAKHYQTTKFNKTTSVSEASWCIEGRLQLRTGTDNVIKEKTANNRRKAKQFHSVTSPTKLNGVILERSEANFILD